MSLPHEKLYSKEYTTDYIEALPDGQRAELVDGKVYNMSSPTYRHQQILFKLARKIADHIDEKGMPCEAIVAPFAVYLNADNRNYVEPDISVICDKFKLTDKGCVGAPDWIIEVVSPASSRMDYYIKLFKYRTAGVREYWIVDAEEECVTVYDFANDDGGKYGLADTVPVGICEGFSINLAELGL